MTYHKTSTTPVNNIPIEILHLATSTLVITLMAFMLAVSISYILNNLHRL